jgi:hypothetical protein
MTTPLFISAALVITYLDVKPSKILGTSTNEEHEVMSF